MFLQNLSKLLDDPRRRSIILVTFLLLLTMIFVGGVRLLRQVRSKRLPQGAKIESMRPIRSVPGGTKKPSTQAYARLQIEHNKKKAEEAKKTGRSSVATIVDSFNLDSPDSSQQAVLQKAYSAQLPTLRSETENTIAQHQSFMSQQQVALNKQHIQSSMHQQMDQLFNAWQRTPVQSYEKSMLEISSYARDIENKTRDVTPPLIKAGTILPAILLTEVNSDEPSPVLAQITTGDFKEARLIGTLSRIGERLLVQFHTLSLPKNKRTLSIQALGVDEATARTSLMSHIDRHTLLRYGSFFSALFIQGFGMSLQNEGSRLASQKSTNALSPTGPLLSATGNVSAQFGSELAQNLHIPPTVCIHAGVTVGILFTADLENPSPSKV